MGITENIANYYKNIDAKLGGRLPGGYTPSQVKRNADAQGRLIFDLPGASSYDKNLQTNNVLQDAIDKFKTSNNQSTSSIAIDYNKPNALQQAVNDFKNQQSTVVLPAPTTNQGFSSQDPNINTNPQFPSNNPQVQQIQRQN